MLAHARVFLRASTSHGCGASQVRKLRCTQGWSPACALSSLSSATNLTVGQMRPPGPARYAGQAPRPELKEVIQFVEDRGYSQEVAQGVVEALLAAGGGIHAGNVLAMVKSMAGAIEIGEGGEALASMAASVQQEVARKAGKQIVPFRVVGPGGKAVIECEGLEGMSLKEVVEHGQGRQAAVLAEYIECACNGVMACSTCHVYVHPDWFARVGPPCEAEQDMLDLAHDPRDTSRLGCQLMLRPELAGMEIEIPGGCNNLFDDIPFED